VEEVAMALEEKL